MPPPETLDATVATLKERLDTVIGRDAECRQAQHESWQRIETRMTATEKAVLELGNRLETETKRGATKAQVAGQAITTLGMIAAAAIAAWSSIHAAQAAALAQTAAKALGGH